MVFHFEISLINKDKFNSSNLSVAALTSPRFASNKFMSNFFAILYGLLVPNFRTKDNTLFSIPNTYNSYPFLYLFGVNFFLASILAIFIACSNEDIINSLVSSEYSAVSLEYNPFSNCSIIF